MNKKTFFIATIASTLLSFSSVLTIEPEERQSQLRREEEQLQFIRRLQRPRNPHETPETPKVMLHDKNQSRWRPRDIMKARIFFDTHESGEPCYRRISEHLDNNPDFGNVKLIIYHEKSDSFEYIGIISDYNAREKFEDSMTKPQSGIFANFKHKIFGTRLEKDGVWCPAQKNKNQEAFFVAGINDTSVCNRYAEFTKENNSQVKKKFGK